MDPKPQLIETISDLESLCKQLTSEVVLGIDTEADSLHHYLPKVCLIQIATKEKTFLIDPLAMPTMEPLAPLFAGHRTKKIFHGADYDIRSLYRDFGISVNNLFDTMVALQFVGEQEPALAAVVNRRFGVTLNKKYQRANWSKRPLSPEMILYAADDTAYLIALHHQLVAELRARGRLSWVEEECEILSQVPSTGLCSVGSAVNERNSGNVPGRSKTKEAPTVPLPLFRRFKGAGRMAPRDLAVLESILQFRERMAMKQDRPPFRLFPNRIIPELVSVKPTDHATLAKVPDLPPNCMKRHAGGILKAIQKGLELPADQLPHYPKSRRPPPDRKKQARLKRLKSWRSLKARQLELQTGLICSNTVLDALAERNPKAVDDLKVIPGMRAWQRKVFGREVIGVIQKPS